MGLGYTDKERSRRGCQGLPAWGRHTDRVLETQRCKKDVEGKFQQKGLGVPWSG